MPNEAVTVYGWRLEKQLFGYGMKLKYATLRLTDQQTCTKENQSPNRLCASGGTIAAPCHGSWGAPAVEFGVQIVAVVSMVKEDCDVEGFARLEAVSPHLQWMAKTMRAHCTNDPNENWQQISWKKVNKNIIRQIEQPPCVCNWS